MEHPPLGERDLHVWVVPLDDPDKKRRRELAHLAEGRVLASYLGVTPAMLEFERGPTRQAAAARRAAAVQPLALRAAGAAGGDSPRCRSGSTCRGRTRRPRSRGSRSGSASPREYERFAANPDPEELLRLWARKEAVIKARGEGSYVAVDGIDVLDDEIDGGWLCRDIALSGRARATTPRPRCGSSRASPATSASP